MKLSLPLTIQEIQSLAFICKQLGNSTISDFVNYAFVTSMSDLVTKLIRKLPLCRRQRKYSVTLDAMQVFTIYVFSTHIKHHFGAYEKILIEKIIAEIDKKYQREMIIKNALKSN